MRDTTARITLPTLDHGDVVLPEPSWCLGHADHQPQYRVDLTHTGPSHFFELPTSRGPAVLLEAMLGQDPFASAPEARGLHMWVAVDGDGYKSAPGDLDAMAAALVEHAAKLRGLARELAVILAREAGR